MSEKLNLSLEDIIAKNRQATKKPFNKKSAAKAKPVVAKVKRSAKISRDDSTVVIRKPGVNVPIDAPAPSRKQITSGKLVSASNGPKKSIFDRVGVVTPSGTKVIIANLNSNVTAADIAELCGTVGETKRVDVRFDKQGRSLGTAEVLFARQSDAMSCVKKFNGLTLDGTPMKVYLLV